MAYKSFLKFVGFRQNSKPELTVFRVTSASVSAVTTGTGGLDEGSKQGTILRNATGDYTITFNRVNRRTPVLVSAVPLTEDLTVKISSISTSAVRVVFANLSGTDTNTDFHLTVMQFFGNTER